jgi:CBS-domain-containing membrane protein
MLIRDCMKKYVISARQTDTIRDITNLLVKCHIGTLPIVEENYHLVGLLQLRDLLTLVMPDFINLVENFDYINDFGAVEKNQPADEIFLRPISEIMKPPVCVEADSGLLRAFSLLYHHNLSDLPVIDHENLLIGIVSRVDLGTALLENWFSTNEKESP